MCGLWLRQPDLLGVDGVDDDSLVPDVVVDIIYGLYGI